VVSLQEEVWNFRQTQDTAIKLNTTRNGQGHCTDL